MKLLPFDRVGQYHCQVSQLRRPNHLKEGLAVRDYVCLGSGIDVSDDDKPPIPLLGMCISINISAYISIDFLLQLIISVWRWGIGIP